MADVTGILESSLYFDDLDGAARFYEELFGFTVMVGDQRLRALRVREGQVLLLFQRGASLSLEQFPTHDGSGPLHLAFSIREEDFAAWQQLLAARNIPIEAHTQWPRGGQSLYFRDPGNHLLELVTPGCWPNY
jgi:catechol-2,3-dioxygenase